MKKQVRAALAVLSVFAFMVASWAQEPSTAADAARAAIAFMEQAWNQHDMNAFSELFTDDADFVNVVGTRWHGRASIREAHATMHAGGFKASRLTMVNTTIKSLGTDAVAAQSLWRLEGHTTLQGNPDSPRKGVMTNVLVRQGSTWKIAVTQNTDIVE